MQRYNFGDFDKVNKEHVYVLLDPERVPQQFIDQFSRAETTKLVGDDEAKKAVDSLRDQQIIEVDYRFVNKKYSRLAACIAWAAKRDGQKEKEEEQEEEQDEPSSLDSENNWIRVPSSVPITRTNTGSRSPSPNRDQLQPIMPVDLASLVRSVPTFKEDFKTFEAYLNKLEAFFKICKVDVFADQMSLLEYAIAEHSEYKILIDGIRADTANTTFALVRTAALELIDGKIQLTKGQVMKNIFSFKLSQFDSVKQYFQAFVEQRAIARADAVIDESVLVEAFVEGLDENMRLVLKSQEKATLTAAYKLAETMMPNSTSKTNNVSIGFVRRGGGGGAGRGNNNNNRNNNGGGRRGGYNNGRNGGGGAAQGGNGGRRGGNGGGRRNDGCFACGDRNHGISQCPTFRRFKNQKNNNNNNNNQVRNVNVEDVAEQFDNINMNQDNNEVNLPLV